MILEMAARIDDACDADLVGMESLSCVLGTDVVAAIEAAPGFDFRTEPSEMHQIAGNLAHADGISDIRETCTDGVRLARMLTNA